MNTINNDYSGVNTSRQRDVKASVENNDIKEEVESVKNNIITFNRGDKIKVYITAEDKVEEVSVEEYVCGVVSNEMPISFNEEALKAQAVASRTYLASKLINKCRYGKATLFDG